ncbi:hypothetical protein [Streptomyces sp. Ag109_G2-15]|uniref:hypothetical protein n=1 Tax=Streptomyces sp. Ag109_G2-15 TaxID=1938850 RepID=UPI00117C4A9A|nr:hypothetical protein [Streptomyces sp. Ag109_G2-15]
MRRGSALVGLLLLAVIAALTLDVVQMASPTLRSGPCGEPVGRWIAEYPRDDFCVWAGALGDRSLAAPDAVSLDLTMEERDRLPRAEVRLTLPAHSAVADAVRAGHAVHRPEDFGNAVVGEVRFGDVYPMWDVPTLSPGKDRDHVVVTTSARVPSYLRSRLRSAPSVKLSLRPAPFATSLTLTAEDRVVVASHLPAGARIDTAKVTARLPVAAGAWTVTLGSAERASEYAVEENPAPPTWLRRVEAIGRAVLESAGNWAVLLLGSAPWLLLWLAARTGAFGDGLGARPAWTRYVRLVGLVLAIHVSVCAAAAFAGNDYTLNNAFAGDAAFGRVVSRRVPWQPALSIGLGGTCILLAAATLTLLPTAVRRAGRARPAGGGNGRVLGHGWGLVAVAALCAGAVLLAAAGPSLTPPTHDILLAALALYGGAFLLLTALASTAHLLLRTLRHDDGSAPPSLGAALATALVLTGLAVVYDYYGYLPWALRWVPLLVTGATGLLSLTALGHRAVTGRPMGRRTLAWLAPVAVALSVPWHLLGDSYPGWDQVTTLAQEADGLLACFLAGAAVLTLRRLGRSPVVTEDGLRGLRSLGVAATLIVLSGSYSFYRGLSVWSLLAALLGALFLLPRDQVAPAAAVLSQNSAEQRGSLARTVMAGAARRQLSATGRALREKTAEDGGSLVTQQLAVRRLELAAARDREGTPTGSATTTRQRALGGFTSRRPWQRGLWGARWGLLIGLPWTALDLAGTAHLPPHEFYPLLSAAGALLPATLRWAGLGLLFGYFFPLVAGESGLAKALRLAAAAAAPTVLDAVLVPHHGSVWPGGTLSVVQLLAFCLSLGLLADSDTLARHRYHWARLADVHNLGSLAAWFSAVAAALATGVAALLLAGLQPFVTNLVQPPQTPQGNPPASTASR